MTDSYKFEYASRMNSVCAAIVQARFGGTTYNGPTGDVPQPIIEHARSIEPNSGFFFSRVDDIIEYDEAMAAMAHLPVGLVSRFRRYMLSHFTWLPLVPMEGCVSYAPQVNDYVDTTCDMICNFADHTEVLEHMGVLSTYFRASASIASSFLGDGNFPVGAEFDLRGREHTVSDVITAINSSGAVVETTYHATYLYCGHPVLNRGIQRSTIAHGTTEDSE